LFQKVLGIAYDNVSKWEKVIENNLIKIEKIKPENSPVVLLRAWATIEGFTPLEVFEQIFNTEKRCKWDNVTAYMTTVETIDENSDIIHFVIKVFFYSFISNNKSNNRLLSELRKETSCKEEMLLWIIQNLVQLL